MNVYSVNKGIGYASSGVEYAQMYRKELFEYLDLNDQYIFLNYLSTNITVYTNLMGYHRQQIIWIYNFLSHRSAENSTFTVDQFLAGLGDELRTQYELSNQTSQSIDVKVDQMHRYKIWLLETGMINRVDYFVNNTLVSVSHYDKTLNNVEEYHQGKLVKRSFYDLKGNQCYEQFYKSNEISVTFIDNQVLYGQMAFYQYFFQQLSLRQDDVVIIDRPLDVIEGILPVLAHKVRLFSVVHAEHYNKNLTKGKHILWNNNYEYIFENANYFEAIIVATDRQNQILTKQLNKKTKIITIPVGYINSVSRKKTYQPYSMITASRLAIEKHIDVLIRAVVIAKEKLPSLTLDIYGEGGERSKLEEVIEKWQAEEYVKLRGHQDLSKVYTNYSVYVSASTSEGFGLSLLEALGAGLPQIGVDVDYGNREFIENGQNGILFEGVDLQSMPEVMAQTIVSFYEQHLDETGRQVSKTKAKAYLKKNVADKWSQLLETGTMA
ncbi:glycosyltransferase [Leuconostoc mesenteroides]